MSSQGLMPVYEIKILDISYRLREFHRQLWLLRLRLLTETSRGIFNVFQGVNSHAKQRAKAA